jgi:hypothetical protein
MALLDLRNRAPSVEILPDLRLRVTRKYDVLNFVDKTPAGLASLIELPWGTQDDKYTQCRLIKQDVAGQDGKYEQPCADPAYLVRVFEQIDQYAETAVGNADVSIGQDGLYQISQSYLQFSAGTAIYQIPGTSTAPAPWSLAILKTEDRTDDGTLRRIKRIYTTTGLVHQEDETKFNGALLMRTLISIGVEPTTPANYTRVSKDVNFVNGLPIFTIRYACGSVPAGAGGVISTEVQYGFSPDAGTTGVTWTTIRYISDPSVGSNPITPPGGSVEIAHTNEAQDGFIIWTGKYASGTGTIATNTKDEYNGDGTVRLRQYSITAINADPAAPSPTLGGTVILVDKEVHNGSRFEDGTTVHTLRWIEAAGGSGVGLVLDESQATESGALIIYHRVSLGTAPVAPTATIGGTVTQFESTTRQQEGHVVYDVRWAEGHGQNRIETRGNADGSILYEVSITDVNGTTAPSYPGSGTAYCTSLSHAARNGYFLNVAVWHKLPATITLKRQTSYEFPGLAYFTYSPDQLVLQPPITRVILADHVISYGTAQDTTVPWSIIQPISYFYHYTPTATGDPISGTEALGRYIGRTGSVSGTAAIFNGVLCDSYSATLANANPSTLPSGATVLHNDNDVYLTDIAGVVVYRNHKVSYTF